MTTASAPANKIPAPTDDDYDLMKQIRQRWNYYRGTFPAPLVDPEDNKPDPNCVTANRLRSIVDTGVHYLLKDNLTIDVSGAGQNYQQMLDKAWRSKERMMTFLIEEAQSGGVGGHQYWQVLPPGTQDNMSRYARFIGLSPDRVAMQTLPDDVSIITRFIIEYASPVLDGGNLLRRQVFERVDPNPSATEGEDVIENWEISYYEGSDANSLSRKRGPVPWAQFFSPILQNKNLPNPHEVHGLTDIENDLVELQLALNRAKTNADILNFLYSHPKYWSDNPNAAEIDFNIRRVIGVGPGNTLNAIDARTAMQDSLAYIESIMEDMDELSGVPQIATGRIKDSSSLGRLSGTAIKLMFMRLIAKTLLKRLLYGATYIKASQIHLHFAGVPNAFEIQPLIKWPDIVPNSAQDLQALAASAPMLQGIGISDDSLGTLMGFDMSEERQKKAQQDAEALRRFNEGRGMPPGNPVPEPVPPTNPQPEPMPAMAGGD